MKWTIKKIAAWKTQTDTQQDAPKEPLATVTAYDAITGRIADAAGAALVLVGDSLGDTALGFDSTLPVTMEMMLHHTAATRRGVRDAALVADMPFMSYQASQSEAIANAGKFLQLAGADAVKLEGGRIRAPLIKALTDNGIPVMAHIGLMPQSFKQSGYAVKGRDEAEMAQIRDDLLAVAEAGAFCVVLECVNPALAAELTRLSPIPTIGIGSGAACDGQVLVISDLLGLTDKTPPKFVKRFANLFPAAVAAVADYAAEVRARKYPEN